MKYTTIFKGNSESDFLNITASNPIDILSLSLDDHPETLIDFVKKYEGKFLAGFISYEYGVKQLGVSVQNLNDFPAAHFRVYDSFDKNKQLEKSKNIDWDQFKSTLIKSEYDSGFEKIQNHIRSGNFYQINFTHLLKSKTKSIPKELFVKLRENNQVGYSVFMEHNDWAIHSLSPEQFIKIENQIITTKPIKGTFPRGISQEEDDYNLNSLLNSKKEQAELYMIIDLLRNDLGKVCKTGSVEVLQSKSIQKLEKVFHTFGVIQGKLKSNLHPIEALLSISPGGSISGCPKKRACEIINSLESQARGIYTGTIGYILPDGSLNFNIAIRTVTQIGEELTLGVGGGITIESTNENEYMETLMKASSFQP